ncbi:ATP-binding cassette domain-containing protein [Tissierella sp. MSJ-40]|uniref:ATP-binding cassette domain-containing protein n=1 Tax=Tissierella simiarum TaxID=2841534 RepID=A0ABS6E515_9FIRM|nr:ATP-binding cassette domain-containing protein [Tissierella simiarum]MBU5438007.1 ATP-binding cassette domain-containing protein [Tissierella simiarum]
MLRLDNISKTFNENTANEMKLFKEFNLKVEEGEFVCVIGSNGAGKSTLLNLITGNIYSDKGKIYLDKEDITNKKEHERCKDISRIFQNPSMGTVPSMTIFENLSMAKNKGEKMGLSFLANKKDRKLFKERLERLNLGLENKLDTAVSQLSGGQRQSLALIMSTFTNPKLLLLDEHTAALDPKTSEIIMEITARIVEEKNLTALMVTHNIDHALKYGNRIIMLHRGNIVIDLEGNMKKDLNKEQLLGLFKDISDRSFFS